MTDVGHTTDMDDPSRGVIPPLTLGIRLYMAMQFAECSREHLAAHVGVSCATISRWVHDEFKRPPSRGNLVAWADRCGVAPAWLIDGVGTMPVPPPGRAATQSEIRPDLPRKRRNSVYNSVPTQRPYAEALAGPVAA